MQGRSCSSLRKLGIERIDQRIALPIGLRLALPQPLIEPGDDLIEHLLVGLVPNRATAARRVQLPIYTAQASSLISTSRSSTYRQISIFAGIGTCLVAGCFR